MRPEIREAMAVAMRHGARAAGLRRHASRSMHRRRRSASRVRAEDRDTWQRCCMADTFQSMQPWHRRRRPSRRKYVAAAREAYQRTPQGGAQLRYALLLATPGHPARDPAHGAASCCASWWRSRRPWSRSSVPSCWWSWRSSIASSICRRTTSGCRADAARTEQRAQCGSATAPAGGDGRERTLAQAARRCAGQARCDRHIERNLTQRKSPSDGGTSTVNQAINNARPASWWWMTIPGLLRLLTIRLRAENYDVEAVENGVQALAAASRFRPDLVISDLRMDQLDGIGLLKELQNRWPGLKVILLTAHGTIPDAVQATQMGAFGFLTKPVEKQELLDQVQKALKISGFVDTDQDWRADFITRSPVMEEKLAPGAHGRRHRCARADHRRKRHRQGTAGPRHSQGEPAPQPAVRRRSTAAPWPRTCSRANCSVTSRARSPGATSDHRGLFHSRRGRHAAAR